MEKIRQWLKNDELCLFFSCALLFVELQSSILSLFHLSLSLSLSFSLSLSHTLSFSYRIFLFSFLFMRWYPCQGYSGKSGTSRGVGDLWRLSLFHFFLFLLLFIFSFSLVVWREKKEIGSFSWQDAILFCINVFFFFPLSGWEMFVGCRVELIIKLSNSLKFLAFLFGAFKIKIKIKTKRFSRNYRPDQLCETHKQQQRFDYH